MRATPKEYQRERIANTEKVRCESVQGEEVLREMRKIPRNDNHKENMRMARNAMDADEEHLKKLRCGAHTKQLGEMIAKFYSTTPRAASNTTFEFTGNTAMQVWEKDRTKCARMATHLEEHKTT